MAVRRDHIPFGKGLKDLRDLIGETAYGVYKGRAAILITSSEVTRGAREAADEVGITIVARGLLAQLHVVAFSIDVP
jgi:hypothetical protein